MFASSKDNLSIFLGEPDGNDQLFSKNPVAKIKANAFGELSSPDLNHDGFSDMIIYYPTNKERKGTLEVLINRGRW